MSQKIMIGVLCLLMVPFLEGCDERDVAAGAAVGAIVGGALVAATSDDYYHDRYYRNRYDNYYRYRRARYANRYGRARYGHRYGNRYERRNRGWCYGRRGRYRSRSCNYVAPVTRIAMTSSTTSQETAPITKFADFYQMPMDSAVVIWTAQQDARNGDLQGLIDLGLFTKDFEDLKNMKAPSKETLYRIALRTGLAEDHVHDILIDFQQELLASQKAGRIAL